MGTSKPRNTMRTLFFLSAMVAVAIAMPAPEVAPEIELTEIEAAAHESIQSMTEAGKSDAACRNMAEDAAKMIEKRISSDQKLIDSLPKGTDCDHHVGDASEEIRAAKKALEKAQAAASKADETAKAAAKKPVKVGKVSLSKLGKGKCSAVFGT